jgi:hypothetical protein
MERLLDPNDSEKEGQKVGYEHDISSGQTHEMMPLKEEMMRIAKHD